MKVNYDVSQDFILCRNYVFCCKFWIAILNEFIMFLHNYLQGVLGRLVLFLCFFSSNSLKRTDLKMNIFVLDSGGVDFMVTGVVKMFQSIVNPAAFVSYTKPTCKAHSTIFAFEAIFLQLLKIGVNVKKTLVLQHWV